MPVVIVALAVLIVAGGVLAAAAANPRIAVIGMAVAVAGAGFVADPLPGPTALLAEGVGAALAGYLGWMALRASAPLPQDPQGPAAPAWPGAVGIAMAAFLAGWLTATAMGRALPDPSAGGPTLANVGAGLAAGSPIARAGLGAAFALIALAIGQVLIARDVLRLGLCLMLMAAATELLRASLGAPADDTVTYAFAILYATGGAAVAAVVARSLDIHDDLELRSPGPLGSTEAPRMPTDARPGSHVP